MTWQQVLDLGMSLVRLAQQLATSVGISDAEFRSRHQASMASLGVAVDDLIVSLKEQIK